jgi:hypothetical protein
MKLQPKPQQQQAPYFARLLPKETVQKAVCFAAASAATRCANFNLLSNAG